MDNRLESHMIGPICSLMRESMGLCVIAEEFSSGYGIADLVGASVCRKTHIYREEQGLSTPLDRERLVEVLLMLKPGRRRSLNYLVNRISFSENLFYRYVLPQLKASDLISIDSDGYVHLLSYLPPATKNIVAIEAKQTKWREAILQARRYTFFANQTYVAVWSETVNQVDKKLLYRHRLGLIEVQEDSAHIVFEAPKRSPRKPKMNRYCSEYMYRLALEEQVFEHLDL